MAGTFVYPGGGMDDGDSHFDMLARSVTPLPDQGCHLPENQSDPDASWRIAAIREVFEETGLLYVCGEDGRPVRFDSADMVNQFIHCRTLLNSRKITFLEFLRNEGLYLSLGELHYYARWITPEVRPMRFDTCFFVALAPPCQEASSDRKETTEGIWLEPERALHENLRCAINLSPPTLVTLEALARFRTWNALKRSLKDRVIEPVLPIVTKCLEESVVVFPWDEDYGRLENKEITGLADLGKPWADGEKTTRCLLKDSRCLPYVKA